MNKQQLIEAFKTNMKNPMLAPRSMTTRTKQELQELYDEAGKLGLLKTSVILTDGKQILCDVRNVVKIEKIIEDKNLTSTEKILKIKEVLK